MLRDGFGPEKKSAIIEGSKIFSKNLMKKYNIPTASYETFSDYKSTLKYLETMAMPVVIKADGLALGKGVTLAQNKEEAIAAIKSAMLDKKFGKSGENIVIEEFLKGVEISVLTFTDSKTIVPMISSMDHKLSKDDDKKYTKEISELSQEVLLKKLVQSVNQSKLIVDSEKIYEKNKNDFEKFFNDFFDSADSREIEYIPKQTINLSDGNQYFLLNLEEYTPKMRAL